MRGELGLRVGGGEMPVVAVVGPEMRREGAYLTDEKRLFRVLDSQGTQVRLEDCRHVDEQPVWVDVSAIRGKMRLVRPG